MNQDQNPKGDFEDRLLAELRAIVAGREPANDGAEAMNLTPGWRRGPRLAFAGGAVTAVAAAALVVGAGGNDTPAAYAITPHGDGKLSVEIRRLGDPKGLQHALDAAGVPADVEYVMAEPACEIAPTDSVEGVEATLTEPIEPARLTVDPSEVGPGEKLVVVAARAGEGIALTTKIAEVGPELTEAKPKLTETLPAEADPGVPAEGDGDGGTDSCVAPKEVSAAAPTVPAVPAEGAGEPGVPASH